MSVDADAIAVGLGDPDHAAVGDDEDVAVRSSHLQSGDERADTLVQLAEGLPSRRPGVCVDDLVEPSMPDCGRVQLAERVTLGGAEVPLPQRGVDCSGTRSAPPMIVAVSRARSRSLV